MGAFESGSSNIRSIGVGARTIAMPNEYQQEVLQTTSMFRDVDIAFKAASNVPAVLRDQWANLKREWDEFRKGASWDAPFWYSNVLKATQYRARIETFRVRLAQATKQPPIPWPPRRGAKPLPGSTKKDNGFPWGKAFWVGAAIVGVYAVSEMMGSGTELRREFRQPFNGNGSGYPSGWGYR